MTHATPPGGGRPHLWWVLAVVLALAGLVSVALSVGPSLDGGETSSRAGAAIPAPDGSTRPPDGDPALPSVAQPAGGGTQADAPVSLPPSPPVSLSIPAIDVRTDLGALGLNPDNTVQVPTDFDQAGWYTGAPTPGQLGPAVVLGHVDSYRGPAVFHRLDELDPGDTIDVTRADGIPARFIVDSVDEYPKDQFPTDQVYGAIDQAGLRLITCGGPFDRNDRSYLNNIVVYAHLDTPKTAAPTAPDPQRTEISPAQAAPPEPTSTDPQDIQSGATSYAALGGLTGPPTLSGRVVGVLDPATAVVEVQRRRITVSAIGLDLNTVPACARTGGTNFANRVLTGQDVTLVADPSIQRDPQAPTWPAYLVLEDQQSYTDAALLAGWADPGPGRYRSSAERQYQQAQDDRAGMWGPPCDRPVDP